MPRNTIHIFLSIFLAITIIAPSIITLIDDSKTMELVLEQNEDENQKENKEGEKEQKVKDSFYHVWNGELSSSTIHFRGNTCYIPEGYSNPSLNVFLPPPEFI